MNLILKFRKPIALFFLLIFSTQLLLPGVAWALTTGPAQPEMQGFRPAGTSDMVDLFTGDFSYNLPLLDVGGYPVNLSYHSGSGMDDEASWVGLGWTLSPGVMNRQMRGLPDDFNGDLVSKEFNMKDDITAGGNVEIYPEFFGFGKNVHMGLEFGIFKNSYRGWGADLGANVALKLTDAGAGSKTASGDDNSGLGSVSLGVGTNSQSGASIKPAVNLDIYKQAMDNFEVNGGLSVGSGYNSRSGVQSLTLSANLGTNDVAHINGETIRSNNLDESVSSTISFARYSYTPIINTPFDNQSYTFSASFGPVLFGIHTKGSISGYYMKQQVARPFQSLKAYGMLNAQRGQQDPYALMDFNRENDIPYQDGVPYLPMPVATADLFTASSQQGMNQYKIYRNGSGVVFDHKGVNNSFSGSLGVEIGAGNIFQGGVDIYAQKVTTKAGKWQDQNDYLKNGAFADADKYNPLMEPAYFKRVGEPLAADESYYAGIYNEDPLRVDIQRGKDVKALSRVITGSGVTADLTQPIKRSKREKRNNVFSYLNAQEASIYGLDKTINSYPKNQLVLSSCDDNHLISHFSRTEKPSHHFSEIITTDNSGSRSVYGIPVYNQSQTEATFSVASTNANAERGLVKYTSGTDDGAGNNIGRDHYASKQTMPGYAYSYLLTGILSPDYADVTGDGISDDDPGTAVKFNYTRLTTDYKWRTPFEKDSANYNANMLSDKNDDKANYTYGKKEIWYMHSIASKTMVAMFFMKDREDGLGVQGSAGGKETSIRQQYLDHIDLYTKSDLLERGELAVPLKTVHFEYDYSLCGNTPNNTGNVVTVNGTNINARKGKLTLKKVYFTFGANRKGVMHPYIFHYNEQINGVDIDYGHRQTDRWGTYKNSADNPGGLRNDEFPYTLQDKAQSDLNTGLWQMSRIELPTGGEINVTYESDDYAYVQDKRAMQMCMLAGIDSKGKANGLIHANELLVNLPEPVNSEQELMFRYFQGMEKLYFKTLVDLDGKGHEEYVPGYGVIRKVRLVDANTAAVTLDRVDGVSVLSKTAWQFLRINLPLYAYPGSETADLDGDVTQIIRGLVAAVKNIKELVEDFNGKAERLNFADKVNLDKSWVRLCSPSLRKLGGGSRVKSIRMTDAWHLMSGEDIPDGSYGQDYDYNTTSTDAQGRPITVSSGVAAYEPMIGNDENPFRQPFSYQDRPSFLGLNNYYYMEDPIGESYFPAPVVGYSKVTVRNVGADNSNNKTGFTVSDFYTARDFPVIVRKMDKNQQTFKQSPILSLFKVKIENSVGVSQGYAVELNDMHGKLRAQNTYNRGGGKISGAEYFYKTENALASRQRLENSVLMIKPDGSLQQGRIGEDIELLTDMREQHTENIGGSIHASAGAFMAWIFPIPYIYPGIGPNIETREFRSASTVKVINKFGVLSKVKAYQDGSSTSTENLAWDSETGDVLLTRTYNEFDDPLYNLAYPAHWAYEGMGQAYKNIGLEISGVSTNGSKQLVNIPDGLLHPGDEVINSALGSKCWISQPEGETALYVIDAAGVTQSLAGDTLKVIRSGRRNQAGAPIGSIVALHNPIKGGKIDVTAFTQVVNVSALTYKDEWQVPLKQGCDCPDQYVKSADGLYCEKYDTIAKYRPDSTRVCDSSYESYGVIGTYVYDTVAVDSGYVYKVLTSAPLTTYTVDGIGPGQYITGNPFWINGTHTKTDGPLNRCGVWGCTFVPYGLFIGFSTTINVPQSKRYYIGMGGDNKIRLTLDQTVLVDQNIDSVESFFGAEDRTFTIWHVFPVDIPAGTHTLKMEGLNVASVACMGAEIYNNTAAEIMQATSYSMLDTIFSSRNMRGRYFQVGDTTVSCPDGYSPSASGDYCIKLIDSIPATQVTSINPYQAGILGNWRPWQQFAWHDTRRQLPELATGGVTNIRRSGIFTSYIPFWSYRSGLFRQAAIAANPNWVMAAEVTKYSGKGEEIENKDALGRYNAALFGYLESRNVVVASNARNTDIGYDGFEDYEYALNCGNVTDTCNIEGHFDFRKLLIRNIKPVTEAAHTGRFSLKLSASAVMKRSVYNVTDNGLLSYNNGMAYTKQNTALKPFNPQGGARYLASVWVKDAAVNAATSNVLEILSGGSVLAASSVAGPQIEGWRKVEVSFIVPVNAADISIKLNPQSSTAYFDDIRVQPFDSQLKSFVYNSNNMFLMAELDENNYATFYEYDDEGTLIRVKKETEKGIMTIKESRSTYKIQ